MKNQRKKGLNIVGYVFLILFAILFLYIRIVRPLYPKKHKQARFHTEYRQPNFNKCLQRSSFIHD